MSATRTEIYREISELQNGLIRLRALLAALEITDSPESPERPRTGWRYIRGTHSGSYVRDPNGTDRLPPGHEAS